MMVLRAVVAMTAMLVLLNGEAGRAGEFDFEARLVGSIQTTEIDSNGDGVLATTGLASLSGLEGAVSTQVAVEVGPGEPGDCPGGGAGLRAMLVSGRGFITFDAGELLIFEYRSGGTCINIETQLTTFRFQGDFLGGTGQFRGATGALEVTGQGFPLLGDDTGRGFIAIDGEFSGAIVKPEG